MLVIEPNAATFGDLQTEFYARGFDYLNQDDAGRNRAKRWLNQAYQTLLSLDPWPFLESTIEEPPTIEMFDVRAVQTVTHNNCRLRYADIRDLTEWGFDLTETGTPQLWYWDTDRINTWPFTTENLFVRYIAIPPDLIEDDDQLILPLRWMDIVIDGAVVKALKDSDNYETVQAARQEYDRQVAEMREALLYRNYADTDTILHVNDLW